MPCLDSYRPTWAEIDLDALAHNLAAVRRRVGTRPVLAVVKADAYGHGAVGVARALVDEGVERLGVAIPEEGVELRRAGVRAPILVLGGFAPSQAELVLQHDLVPALYRPDQVEALSRAAARRGGVAATSPSPTIRPIRSPAARSTCSRRRSRACVHAASPRTRSIWPTAPPSWTTRRPG